MDVTQWTAARRRTFAARTRAMSPHRDPICSDDSSRQRVVHNSNPRRSDPMETGSRIGQVYVYAVCPNLLPVSIGSLLRGLLLCTTAIPGGVIQWRPEA